MQADEYRAFTRDLAERLRADERAIGLVAVGSMADRDYAPDEWSDHDFFVITPTGRQEELRNDLSWLPNGQRIALSLRETDHGLIVIYDHGHLLEFAVFDLEEIALAGVNRSRVLLDRGGVAERIEHVAANPRPPRDDLFLFGKTLAAALVATGRGRRGETLSAAFLVTWATTYLSRLLIKAVPSPDASILDGFDSLRRFERAYPKLGAELAAIVRLAPADAGPALLEVLDRELRPLRPDLPWQALDAVRERISP
jgi:lincosamide nucleotidyltransferase